MIHFAAEQLQQSGKTVWIAQPTIESQDYNDVLKQQGVEVVKTELSQAIPYADYRDHKVSGRMLQTALHRSWEISRPPESWEKLLQEGDRLLQVYSEIQSKQPQYNVIDVQEKSPIPNASTQPQKPSLKLEKEPELDL